MIRFLHLLLALLMLAMSGPAAADPADIDAAARGVVRVVVIGRDGAEIFPVSHGTGFAVGPETIVTNAHVVSEAIEDPRLSLGIVPSDGGDAVFARLVAVSQRNDLALVETTSPMRLPPLTISGNPSVDAGAVTSVGYPQNVDRAQGLEMEEIFRAQPPVKSTGFLSGRRPSREFDTLLHTAPIARGSSGGPLLDECGRVVGVNSFGTESAGAGAEFFFAVSTRELLPFLRANSVSPRINAMPCRSIAELEEAEREREQRLRAAAEAEAAADERALARRREEARREIGFVVQDERENRLALAFMLLVIALAAGGYTWVSNALRDDIEEPEEQFGDPAEEDRRQGLGTATVVGGIVALAALAGAAIAWLSRPGFEDIDQRLEDRLREEMADADTGPIAPQGSRGALTCTLDQQRSRVTGEASSSLSIDWSEDGCVNGSTQYGLAGGTWTRVFVPASEAAVSVNRFDPATGEFVVERFLLDRDSMREARAARGGYAVPSCDGGAPAVQELGDRQAGIISLLPARPNERLVYQCGPVE